MLVTPQRADSAGTLDWLINMAVLVERVGEHISARPRPGGGAC
jgi:hypothetical protein